ncbi:MAG: polyprenyl synthetase family protein [Peptococcaceae bacterium]|nr:polyprenyl synthetase family protein [Peptococcaceae bacterium]
MNGMIGIEGMDKGGLGVDFAGIYSRYSLMIEAVLNELAPELAQPELAQPGLSLREDVLARSLHYVVSGGGKRLRPVLALAVCDLVGGDLEVAVMPAAAVELIHTYSLVHDDLPCMDDDDMRRDKPTAHKVFGEAVALLTGDALLTFAFEVLARTEDLPPEVRVCLVREVAEAAGRKGMVLGQVLDMCYTEAAADLADGEGSWLERLERMHGLKTGKLLRAAARVGALCGGCTPEQLALVTRYAEMVGLAFQIQDDLLDEVGDSSQLGKNTGGDARLGKLTYVSLLGLDEAMGQRDNALAEAGRALDSFGHRADFLRDLADFIAARKR